MYTEEDKMKVVKYACSHGVTNVIRFFKKGIYGILMGLIKADMARYIFIVGRS